MRRVFRLPSNRARIAREVDDELAFHLEERVSRLIAAGMEPEAAHAHALRQFGDVESIRTSMESLDAEREQSSRRVNLLSDFRQDWSYAARALRRNVTLTFVIVLGLGVSIGANTAVFTLIDALVLRTIGVSHPEQLVAIGNERFVNATGRGWPRTEFLSVPLYRDIQTKNTVFSDVAATGPGSRLNVRVDAEGSFERPYTRYVSENFFAVLGVPAFRGRLLDATTDDVAGGSPVATISHSYWLRRFQGNPNTVGRAIYVNGVAITIVGIASPMFTGEVIGESIDVWLPLSIHDVLEPNYRTRNNRRANWMLALGRLKAGATLEQAQHQLKPLIETTIVQSEPAMAETFAKTRPEYTIVSGAAGFSEARVSFETPLFTLLAGVGLLLCIMCANVASLLLARAVARGREMAVRLALGANRARIVRQLMTESALLALLGAMVGLVVAWCGSRGLLAVAADGEVLPLKLGFDLPVLGFTLAIAIATVFVFGLAPALRASRVDLAQTFRAGAHGASYGGRSLSAWRVVPQVALSLVLLTGSAMLARSLRNVSGADTGFDREHLVIAGIDIRGRRGTTQIELSNITHRMRERVSAVPGVVSVSVSHNGLFTGSELFTRVHVSGFVPKAEDDSTVAIDMVGADYARTIGARLLVGRDMTASDEDHSTRTVVVNDAFAKFYYPNTNPVGQFIRLDETTVQIVGVIADVRAQNLAEPPRRRVYAPFLRGNEGTGMPLSMRLIVRTAAEPTALVTSIRQAIESVDRDLPIDRVEPLVRLMRTTIRQERLLARVATGFTVLALLLAAIGLYGTMTYAITRRTGEIGLRVALGALRGDIVRMVLIDAFRLVVIGVVVGVPLALGAAQLLQSQLHSVGPTDPTSFVLAVGVLSMATLVATALPVARASRVSPMSALKHE